MPAAMHTHEYLPFGGNINQRHVRLITAFRAQKSKLENFSNE